MKDWKEITDIPAFARQHGMRPNDLWNRKKHGWSVQEAITIPVGQPRYKKRPMIADAPFIPNQSGRQTLWR